MASSTFAQMFSAPTWRSNSALRISRARLVQRSAENEGCGPMPCSLSAKVLEGVQTRGVDGGHVPQPQNDDRRQLRDFRLNLFQLVGDSRTGTVRGCGRSSRNRESACPAECAASPSRGSPCVTCETVVVLATCRMKSSAARIMPNSHGDGQVGKDGQRERDSPDRSMSALPSLDQDPGISRHSPML